MISSIKNLSTELSIELELGNVCNFKCSYCFPGANTGDKLWPNVDRLSTALIRYLQTHNRKTRLYLVGGETTLWKDLPEFCKTIKAAHDVIITISTNASKSLRWWDQYGDCFDAVHISLHAEESNIDHIIKVADLLYEKEIETNVDVLIAPDNFDKCVKLVELVHNSKNKFPIIAKTVLIDGKHNYTDVQLEYMNEPIKRIPDMQWYDKVRKKPRTTVLIDDDTIVYNDNYFALNNLNYFKNWMCHLGVDIARIDHAGNVKGNCGQTVNQNIYTDDRFKIQPVVCEQEICNCSGEMCVTKWRIDGL